MSLDTEMRRFANTNLKSMKANTDEIRQGVGGVTKAMNTLGAQDDDLTKLISITSSALQTVGGTLGMLRGLKALYEARIAKESAEAYILTAVKTAMGPWGWTEIAIAVGASAIAAGTMYALVNTVEVGEFDLSTSAGTAGMLKALEGVV